MKKLLLMAVATIMATSVFAQETTKKVRLYKDNAVVYERNYSDVDSIVFVDVPALPEGALSGEFSVSATKKVHFSKGNLQATTTDLGANWAWGFAEHQWSYVGNSAANNAINGDKTVSTNGTVDLFGWSTPATYYGIHNGKTTSDYSGNFVDWRNNIGEGWYTLSKDEWGYLFYTRINAASLFGLGSVNGVNGTIILPDNWVTPDGASFTPSTTQGLADQDGYYSNDNGNNFSHNTYTAEQWSVMESAGAVFLPAAGERYGTGVDDVGSEGGYWSSTPLDGYGAYLMFFRSVSLSPKGGSDRYNGQSVRLVR